MHHPTDRIAHTTAFVTPVVEHWLERLEKWHSTDCRELTLNSASQMPIVLWLAAIALVAAFRSPALTNSFSLFITFRAWVARSLFPAKDPAGTEANLANFFCWSGYVVKNLKEELILIILNSAEYVAQRQWLHLAEMLYLFFILKRNSHIHTNVLIHIHTLISLSHTHKHTHTHTHTHTHANKQCTALFDDSPVCMCS